MKNSFGNLNSQKSATKIVISSKFEIALKVPLLPALLAHTKSAIIYEHLGNLISLDHWMHFYLLVSGVVGISCMLPKDYFTMRRTCIVCHKLQVIYGTFESEEIGRHYLNMFTLHYLKFH